MTGERDRKRERQSEREGDGRARAEREEEGRRLACCTNQHAIYSRGWRCGCVFFVSTETEKCDKRTTGDFDGKPYPPGITVCRPEKNSRRRSAKCAISYLPARSLASRALLRCVLGPRARDVRATDWTDDTND